MSMFDGIPTNPFEERLVQPSRDRLPVRSETFHTQYRFSAEQVSYMHSTQAVDLVKSIKDEMARQLEEHFSYYKRLIVTHKCVKSAEFEVNYQFIEEDPYNLRMSGYVQLKSLNGMLLNPTMGYVEIACLEGGAV